MSKWHLINKEGNQIEVDSSEMNDEKYAGYRFDHGWYKAHLKQKKSFVELRKSIRI